MTLDVVKLVFNYLLEYIIAPIMLKRVLPSRAMFHEDNPCHFVEDYNIIVRTIFVYLKGIFI